MFFLNRYGKSEGTRDETNRETMRHEHVAVRCIIDDNASSMLLYAVLARQCPSMIPSPTHCITPCCAHTALHQRVGKSSHISIP